MFGSSKPKRPSEVAAEERSALLLASTPGTANDIAGWTARDIYLFQDARGMDAQAYQSKRLGPVTAMIYLMGRRAALKGISAKLPAFEPVDTRLSQYDWFYYAGFLDAIADKALGTDRVPPEVRELYPDYQAIDAR